MTRSFWGRATERPWTAAELAATLQHTHTRAHLPSDMAVALAAPRIARAPAALRARASAFAAAVPLPQGLTRRAAPPARAVRFSGAVAYTVRHLAAALGSRGEAY